MEMTLQNEARWRRWPLPVQFLLAGAVVMALAMMVPAMTRLMTPAVRCRRKR